MPGSKSAVPRKKPVTITLPTPSTATPRPRSKRSRADVESKHEIAQGVVLGEEQVKGAVAREVCHAGAGVEIRGAPELPGDEHIAGSVHRHAGAHVDARRADVEGEIKGSKRRVALQGEGYDENRARLAARSGCWLSLHLQCQRREGKCRPHQPLLRPVRPAPARGSPVSVDGAMSGGQTGNMLAAQVETESFAALLWPQHALSVSEPPPPMRVMTSYRGVERTCKIHSRLCKALRNQGIGDGPLGRLREGCKETRHPHSLSPVSASPTTARQPRAGALKYRPS